MINSPEQGHPDEVLTPEQHLARVGLSPESLNGKNVLVIHASESPLGEDPKPYGANLLTDFDPSWEGVEDDLLPFKTPRFDYVIADEGVLREGLCDPMLDLLAEAVRVSRYDGEIRIYDPFEDIDDPDELYDTLQDMQQFLRYKEIRGTIEYISPDESNKLSRPYLRFTKKRPYAMSDEFQA